MLILLSWRNLWRNHRRTLLTIVSVMLAVVLATTLRCLQNGTYDIMINNVVGYYTGYLQIQAKDYWQNRSIDEAFEFDSSIAHQLDIKRIKSYVPRLEQFVLCSSETKTKASLLIGTDPEREDATTKLASRVVSGHYFHSEEHSVLLSQGMATSLKLGVGDTIVVLGQGYHGIGAAGKYPVCGIVHFASPDLDKAMMYLPLKDAQTLFGGTIVTSVALMLHNPDELASTRELLAKALGDGLEVKDWKEMMPDLVQAIQADSSGGIIMAGVLYLIISFGLFGTLIMMLAERQHEFGTLVAIGMKRSRLALTVFIESLMMGIIGTLAGFCLSIPIVAWLHSHPIHFSGDVAQGFAAYGFEPVLAASTNISIFIAQAELVLAITVVLTLVPYFRIRSIDALQALRS